MFVIIYVHIQFYIYIYIYINISAQLLHLVSDLNKSEADPTPQSIRTQKALGLQKGVACG